MENTGTRLLGGLDVGATRRSVDDLYRSHGSEAERIAYLLTGDRSRAEDVVHEAFVRVLGRLRSIRDPLALRGYLNRTVVNLAKNQHRSDGTRRAFLARPPDPTASVVRQPDLEGRDEVHRRLLRLPYRQRAALVLRYCEDLPEQEVAEIMDTSAKAVRSLVGRGLSTLRNGSDRDE